MINNKEFKMLENHFSENQINNTKEILKFQNPISLFNVIHHFGFDHN